MNPSVTMAGGFFAAQMILLVRLRQIIIFSALKIRIKVLRKAVFLKRNVKCG